MYLITWISAQLPSAGDAWLSWPCWLIDRE